VYLSIAFKSFRQLKIGPENDFTVYFGIFCYVIMEYFFIRF